MRPTIVCLCGSTRFTDAYNQAAFAESLAGHIVLSVGGFHHARSEHHLSDEQKVMLDMLHLHKIDLAQVILVLNVDGYVGESTAREIAYAYYTHKDVRWLNEELGDQYVIRERHKLGAFTADFMANGAPHCNGPLVPRSSVDYARMKGTVDVKK